MDFSNSNKEYSHVIWYSKPHINVPYKCFIGRFILSPIAGVKFTEGALRPDGKGREPTKVGIPHPLAFGIYMDGYMFARIRTEAWWPGVSYLHTRLNQQLYDVCQCDEDRHVAAMFWMSQVHCREYPAPGSVHRSGTPVNDYIEETFPEGFDMPPSSRHQ